VPMPEYQANANPANPLLSTTSRNVPDVAMVATNVYYVHSQGGISKIEDTTNGTSVSTPLWAGFMALANQARTTPGLIGFPNPAIYAIGKDPAKYAASFRDIKDGLVSPACDGTPYSPREGYDQVTGWGTPTCGLIATINNTVLKRVLTVDGAIDDLVDLEGGSNHLGRQPFSLAIPVNQSTPAGSQVFSTCLNNLLGGKIVFTAALSPVDSQTIHACVSEGLHRTSSAIILTRLYGNPDANLSLRVTAGQGQVFHYVNDACGPSFCDPYFFPATGNAGTTGGSFPNITPPANGILPFDIEVEHGAGGTVLIDAQGSYNFATGQISGFDPSGALYQPDPMHPDEFCAHDSATHVTLCWKFETNVDLTACTGNIPTDTPRCWDLPADGGKRIDDGGLFTQPGAAVGTYGALLLNIQDPNP